VAVPCKAIEADLEAAYRYTDKGNLVAVISNGTAVLGLGDIGALAGKPVMEGKGVLFNRFAGIDVFDVVQTSARDMDLEGLYRRYGRHVCFHGAIDVQKDLVGKTPEEIRRIVRRVKELWGNRGGIILAPSHETLPDTPLENLLAVYEAAAEA
jgi:malic enzyme